MLISLGPDFGIHWYGVLIVLGIIFGTYYAAWRARQDGESPDHVWNGVILAIVLSIIGARLYHVFSEPEGGNYGWSYYREHPIEILFIWNGGLGIYGAAVGGALGVIIYAYFAKLRPLQWLDYGAPGMVMGQAIGRWGNFINQELYGPPTGSSWWGLIIDRDYRIVPYTDTNLYPVETTLFHPTFLYESVWCVLVFVALALVQHRWRKKLLEGDILCGYLVAYPLGRFFIEWFFRPDAWMMGGMAAAQWFSIGSILIGATALVVRHLLAGRAASKEEASVGTAVDEASDEASGEAADEQAPEEATEEPPAETPGATAEPDVEPEPET
jgi:phosphatidylglycerol:prolipoprotein diacylglycerol transferase